MKFGQILMSLLLALTFQFVNAADQALPSTLRIGTSAGYPPLSFKQDGRLQGVDISALLDNPAQEVRIRPLNLFGLGGDVLWEPDSDLNGSRVPHRLSS